LARSGRALFPAGPCILVETQFPGRPQSAGQYILTCGSQSNMGHSHSSPSAGNGDEQAGQLGNELGLHLRCEHEMAIALLWGGKRSEYPAPYAKVGCSHMRTLLSTLQAQCYPAKVSCIHDASRLLTVEGPMTARAAKCNPSTTFQRPCPRLHYGRLHERC